MTVHELRKKGYKVRVIHVREKVYKLSKVELRGGYDYFYSTHYLGESAKGGKTIVEVTMPDGRDFYGIAYCHPKDNYNKKQGVKQALARAFQQLSHV